MLRALVPIIACLSSCATAPDIEKRTGIGRHSLPFRPNDRFIITEVGPITGFRDSHPPIEVCYFLDGRERTFRAQVSGETDGYVTYLGRLLAAEDPNRESPIMDELVIRLESGEEITIAGNTVDPGEVRLRSKNQETEQAGVGRP